MENKILKPRTAAATTRSKKHRRTSSQPVLKEMTVKYKFHSGDVSPRQVATNQSSRKTKIDCSKLMNFDIFNVNGVLGNKAIMATTSPSLFMNIRPKSRVKTTAKSKRKMGIESNFAMNDLEVEEETHPLHYKPMTENAFQTERIVKSSLSNREYMETNAIMKDKDKTILMLREKIVFYSH